jgi:predicted nucleic acid-binding protein
LADPETIYIIDTSSIIKWYVEEYPPSIFEKLVDRMEELV